MFFQRELILNVLLAQSRAQRGRIDGTSNAGIVAQKLINSIPPSLLSGVDDIEEITEESTSEAEELRTQLYSPEVSKFLDQAREAAKAGHALDWDVVSKAALLNYYRTYFEKGHARDKQEECAEEWLQRALLINPNHADLKAKYADVLSMMERYEEAVAVIEPLAKSTDGPAYTRQWLGYFLLFVDREEEAISLSEEYTRRFPLLDHAFFNASCGYAQLYGKELLLEGAESDHDSMNRRMALTRLREGLRLDPEFAEEIKDKLMSPLESYASLAKDKEFRQMVANALFKAALKRAEDYIDELRESKKDSIRDSVNRLRALKLLKDALDLGSDGISRDVRGWMGSQEFKPLVNDKDFFKLFNDQPRNGTEK
jgi:tetratricopeptide (TPR) repeat protein